MSALAKIITGVVAILIGALVSITHVAPDLMVTLGLLLVIAGLAQFVLAYAPKA